MKKLIMTMVNGFCMALADSVPGVSGGTVAFLMGFYDHFIGALNDLLTGNLAAKKKALVYLIKLGIGWVIGFGACVLVLTSVFESHIYSISSLFIGFILFAIPIVIMEEKKCLREKPWTAFMVLIGAAGVAALTYFNSGSGGAFNIDAGGIGTYLYVFIAGAIAICAMVLPGISGSTLLLIFGLYIPIMNSIKEIMTFDFTHLGIVLVFGIGVLIGIVSICRAIRVALDKQRSATVYLIIGMMLGSLYSVVMGPTTLTDENDALLGLAPLGMDNFSILFFLLGGVVIIGMQLLGKLKMDSEEASAEKETV